MDELTREVVWEFLEKVEVNEEISVRLFYKFRGSGFSEQPLIFFRETPPVRHL